MGGANTSSDWRRIARHMTAIGVAMFAGFGAACSAYSDDLSDLGGFDIKIPTSYEPTSAEPARYQDSGLGDGDLPLDNSEGVADDLDKLMSMDIDQLANVDVAISTPATLTDTPKNVVPAAVTHITKEDIYRSGARNLNEVLEIFVPNLQWVLHHWEQSHLGNRGIISDREDKYLLLVNDRIMNDKTHYGAASERELPQLDDIHHIDVIRGPGSAVLGPGAISMVISIYTETPETFTGTKAKVRGGFVDEFSTLELTHSIQWCNAEGGLLLYAGIGSRDGAEQWDAPLVLGTSDPGWPGFGNETVLYQGYQAGNIVTNPINNDGHTFRGQQPIKLFADLTYDDFEVWARYTRSGVQYPLAVAAGLHFPNGFGTFVDQFQSETGNQQVTVQTEYDTELNENQRFIFRAGWDSSEFARNLFFGTAEAYRESELNTRSLLVTDFGEHQIAVGGEFYNDWFGHESHLVDAPPTIGRLGADFDSWEAQTYSVLFEDQWELNDEWTTFLGARWDKNIYTPWMYSPRAAVVYTPEENTAWKLLLNRSVRMNFAEELRAQWLANRTLSDPEILRSYELRYERTPSEWGFYALSVFYIDLDAISWNGVTSSSDLTGNQTQWGLEGELAYRGNCCQLIASHSYTKLIDFTLHDPAVTTFITAAPDGFGNNLSAWSNHITKIFYHMQLNSAWSVDGSVRYYWGFPGSRDITDRNNATPDAFGQNSPNWLRPFKESVFVNLGLGYRYNKHIKFRVDGYNLLGAFDSDLNKRLYYGDNSFRSEAPALGLSGEIVY